MSIRVMSLVWDNSRAEGSALLVELALADWADDEGGNIYPSLATIARKTRISKRSVSYHLETLVGLGEVTLSYKTHPHKNGETTNDYQINVDYLRRLGPVVIPSKSTARCKVCNVDAPTYVAKSALPTLQTLQPNPSVDPSVGIGASASASGAPHAARLASGSFGDWLSTDAAGAIRRLMASEGVKKIDDVLYQCYERGLSFVDVHSIRDELHTRYKGSKGRLTQWPGFFTKRFLTEDYHLGFPKTEGAK